MSATVTVPLDRFGPCPPVDDRHRGAVVYLPGRGMVVIVESRGRTGRWWGGVIARRAPSTGRGHVGLSSADLDAGETVIAVDRDADPDGWVMAWQARAWCTDRGGRKAVLARALVERARLGATIRVVLTPEACGRVMRAANLGPYALRAILGRLASEGFLTPVAQDGADETEAYVLTIPDPATALSVKAEVGGSWLR